MKKLFTMFFVFILAFVFTGCNNSKEDNVELTPKELLLNEINNKINQKIESGEYYYNDVEINYIVEELVNRESNDINIDETSKKIFNEVSNLFLDLDIKDKIDDDFEKQYGYKCLFNYFYGEYNNTYFFFVEEVQDVVKEIMIADVKFSYHVNWDIYVWHQNKFYLIEDAFNKEVFDYNTLIKIAQVHNIIKNKKSNNISLYGEVCEAYFNTYIKPKREDASISDVWIFEYLGIYGDCFVAVILDKKDCTFIEKECKITVEDIVFVYSYGYDILVYDGSGFSDLLTAYKESKLTYSNLLSINRLHH